ncbi:ferric-chelate reductase 1-like isoform X3 [Acropora muricata]|uniref:ferric-chelate reductase 1-like isoform X3 n=1 Tax=Acropora muricata TaxID=159855 RepID=UPI0034E3FC51
MGSFRQIALIALLEVSNILGFSYGPPLSTCEYMLPHHRGSKAQTGVSPYNITVSNNSYSPGDNLTVSIYGTKTFTGFMLQAQSIHGSVAWPLGIFMDIGDEAENIQCSGGELENTVSHNNPKKIKWTSRQFTWRAPAKGAGDIHFIGTIVESYHTYWVKVTSPVVTGPPAESVTRGSTGESFQIEKTGCGDTKGCYSLPKNCTGSADCNYVFTYQVSAGKIVMEMSAKERYVAVGFNDQKLMDKMDAIMCATMATNLVELRHYDSREHFVIRNTLLGNTDISVEKIAYEDGTTKCRVTRKLSSSTPFFRDLTKKWYLLFAHGKTSPSGSGQHHRQNYSNTAEMIDLSVPATLVDEQSQVKDTIAKEGCGKTKSCYSEPADCKASSDCNYLVTIKPLAKGKELEFELSAKAQWVSIGFDKDKQMPDSDAIICAEDHKRVSADHYVADQGYGVPTKTSAPSSLVTLFGESSGGIVSCRFKRDVVDSKMANLDSMWFLVYTWGPMRGHVIGKHTSHPKTSKDMVRITEVTTLDAEAVSSKKVQAHGSLMVIAWIGFASVAIFMARYMRGAFDEKKLLGTKIWFTFHRSLSFLTILFTLVSMIVMFYDGHWSAGAGAHAYIGIVVFVLSVIQPFMALMRPDPGAERRYIFNWAHRGVGLTCFLMAVVNIFFGIRLGGANLDDTSLYIMIVYAVGVVVVIVLSEYLSLKTGDKATYMAANKDGKDDHVLFKGADKQSIASRLLVFGFLVVLAFSSVVALVVLIAVAGNSSHHDHDNHHHHH